LVDRFSSNETRFDEELQKRDNLLGGALVFRGTRVTYTTVLQNISDMSVNEIAESYPTVQQELAASQLHRDRS